MKHLATTAITLLTVASSVNAAPRLFLSTLSDKIFEVSGFDSENPVATIIASATIDDLAPASIFPGGMTLLGINNFPGGHAYYSIDVSSGIATRIDPSEPIDNLYTLDLGCDGNLYACEDNARIYTLSMTTGTAQFLFDLGDETIVSDIACRSGPGPRGQFYTAARGQPSQGDQLLLIDLDSMNKTTIGNHTLPAGTVGLDCTSGGRLFGVTSQGSIYEVSDLGTGSCSQPIAISLPVDRPITGAAILDECHRVGVDQATWSIVKRLFKD